MKEDLHPHFGILLAMFLAATPPRSPPISDPVRAGRGQRPPGNGKVQELSLSDPTKPGAVSENRVKLHVFLLAHTSLLSSLLSDFVVQMKTPFQAFCSNHRDKAALFGLFPKQILSREPGRCEQRAAAGCLINHRWWHTLNMEKTEENRENQLH